MSFNVKETGEAGEIACPNDFRSVLNSQQYEAVVASEGPMLVLAAAGTGKTRTLVYRVAALVRKGIPGSRILLLTFTNKAAGEMLQRAEALVGAGVGDLWGGTFHHMANRILRRDADKVGFPRDFTILDRDDSVAIMKQCVKDAGIDTLPKPEVLLAIAGTAANTGISLDAAVTGRFGCDDVHHGAIMKVLNQYADRKKKLTAMDFDDLLVNGLRLLRENPAVLERYQERFLHVLVDEYQDTNHLQAGIVDSVAARHRNLFVVGDDFQCIYEWRGANIENIMTFPSRYPDARTYKLEINYRSVPEILDVANSCTAVAPVLFRKVLKPTRKSGSKPVVAFLRNGDQQAQYVLEIIGQLRSRTGIACSDIAVLYRAHHHAMETQLMLSRAKIPFVITSGVRFFEQAHIKDVCSLLRIAENPADEMAFMRLAGMLPRVGPQSARKAWNKIGGRLDAGDAKSLDAAGEALPPGARGSWARIRRVLGEYAKEGLGGKPGEALGRFVDSWYREYVLETYEDFERRLDEIDELVGYTAKFENAALFLSEVALYTNLEAEGDGLARGSGAANSVKLSTVHQAKGLEWKAVIVLWMVDGMFPSSRTLEESLSGEEEERRLFYVAVTRAKDHLFLCCPSWRDKYGSAGGGMPCQPSRFIRQIPPHLVRSVQIG